MRIHIDVLENGFALFVAEVYVVEKYVARKASISSRTVAVRVLPRPNARALTCLRDVSVRVDFRIYKRDIAVVGLGFFVEKREHARRACLSESYEIDLLRDLTDLHGERATHCKERNHRADLQDAHAGKRDVERPRKRENRADERHKHIHYIADVAEYRHKDIRITICLGRVVEKLVVALVEALFRLLFVIEYLDDLLPLHHFLDIALDYAE